MSTFAHTESKLIGFLPEASSLSGALRALPDSLSIMKLPDMSNKINIGNALKQKFETTERSWRSPALGSHHHPCISIEWGWERVELAKVVPSSGCAFSATLCTYSCWTLHLPSHCKASHFTVAQLLSHCRIEEGAQCPVGCTMQLHNPAPVYALSSALVVRQYIHRVCFTAVLREARPIHYRWIFGKVPKGGRGGSFPIQKILLQFFCIRNCTFGHEFPEKLWNRGGVISDPKNFVANSVLVVMTLEKIATFFPKKGGRGGSKAVWNFSKNSSIMDRTGVP